MTTFIRVELLRACIKRHGAWTVNPCGKLGHFIHNSCLAKYLSKQWYESQGFTRESPDGSLPEQP